MGRRRLHHFSSKSTLFIATLFICYFVHHRAHAQVDLDLAMDERTKQESDIMVPRYLASNTYLAEYDDGMGAPRCDSYTSLCHSGSLLKGNGAEDGISSNFFEINAPNTIDGCMDGKHTSSSFGGTQFVYYYGSVDQIVIRSTSGGIPMTAGIQIEVTAIVYLPAFLRNYRIADFFYASNALSPIWELLQSVALVNSNANNTVSVIHTLVEGNSTQAVRVVLRDNLNNDAFSCTDEMDSDADDLVFAVAGHPTSIPTARPSQKPTQSPTSKHTASPTHVPTLKPTQMPIRILTPSPTRDPTQRPTPDPTLRPSRDQTRHPTSLPTKQSKSLTLVPTKIPTYLPDSSNIGKPSTQKPTSTKSNISFYDDTMGAPRCNTLSVSCDSGVLLLGAGLIEPNFPNTIDGCAGEQTNSMASSIGECINKIVVRALDGGILRYGTEVEAKATLYVTKTTAKVSNASQFSVAHIYYAADANVIFWEYISTDFIFIEGVHIFEVRFTLVAPSSAGSKIVDDANGTVSSTSQVIRVTFGQVQNSVDACSNEDNFDTDDLIFEVAPTLFLELEPLIPSSGVSKMLQCSSGCSVCCGIILFIEALFLLCHL